MKMTGPYWVYLHITPDGMIYVGRSGLKYTYERFNKVTYKTTSLQPYIEKWGWENISHFFIDGLSKEESYRLEGDLIKMYKDKGVCINKQGSCGLLCDGKSKRKEYDEINKDRVKDCWKRSYEKHKKDINERKKKYREEHKEEIRDYYEKHKGEIREYYEKHKEEKKEYQRQYRQRKKLLSQVQPDGCLSLW